MKRFKIVIESEEMLINKNLISYVDHLEMSYANEGIVEKFTSFIQKSFSSEEKLHKFIEQLKGSKVGDIRTFTDGGKYNGLKLIGKSTIDGKIIKEYLKVISDETEYFHVSIPLLINVLKQIMKGTYSINDQDYKKFYNKFHSEIVALDELIKDQDEQIANSHKINELRLKTPQQTEFDEIISEMEKLFSKIHVIKDFLKNNMDYIMEWEIFVRRGRKDFLSENDDNVLVYGTYIVSLTLKYLEKFTNAEKNFVFSLSKYLETSVAK